MLGLVVGKTAGIARNARPIVVRLPAPQGDNRINFSAEEWVTFLSKINDDLGTNPSSEATCVVVIAQYWKSAQLPTVDPVGWVWRVWSLMEQMTAKGAIIVTGSGNVAEGVLDGIPANFGKSNAPKKLPSLIVAGALTREGKGTGYVDDPIGGIPHVYAPVSPLCCSLFRALWAD
jgi:hypothetical protein